VRKSGAFRRAAALAALAGLVVPGLVWGQCGGTYRADAHKDVGRGRPPLAIGDSVMLLAVDRLADVGYNVNARGCLGFQEAIGVIKQQRSEDKLGRLAVVAVGANYDISMGEIRKALEILGGRRGEKRILGLVTPRELGGGSGSDADVVREAGERYPNRVKVLDWVAKSSGHPGWFQPDGLHLTDSGADAYTKLFKKGLRYASWPRERNRLR
jgi:hypothetical protein